MDKSTKEALSGAFRRKHISYGKSLHQDFRMTLGLFYTSWLNRSFSRHFTTRLFVFGAFWLDRVKCAKHYTSSYLKEEGKA